MRKLRSNGADGSEIVTTPTTDGNVFIGEVSGTIATDTMSNVLTALAANDMVLIYQGRGTGAGVRIEMNQVKSYNGGTKVATFNSPLAFTYDSTTGDNQAYIVKLSRLASFENGSVLTAQDWDESKGGAFIRIVSGKFWNKVGSTINLRGKGYLGGGGVNQNANTSQGQTGEGPDGARTYDQNRSDTAGGGGRRTGSGGGVNSGGAASGGHATPGRNGININGADTGGHNTGVVLAGPDFDTYGIFMGPGGGAAAGADPSNFRGGYGGDGGAWGLVICDEFLNEGIIDVRGNDPDNSPHGGNQDGDAAPGASGSFWVIARKYLNLGQILGVGGTYATGGTIGQCGTPGGDGYLQLDSCATPALGNLESTPIQTKRIGGHDFCLVPGSII